MQVYRRWPTRRAISFTLVAWLGLCTKPAHADPLELVTLRLDAPATCPPLSSLNRELRRDLEGSEVPSEHLVVEARFRQLGAVEWQALIQTESKWGRDQRLLKAADCDALVAATSLIIAMQIDPETASAHATKPGMVQPSNGDGSLAASERGTLVEPRTQHLEQSPLATPNRQKGSEAGVDSTQAVVANTPDAASTRARIRGIAAAWIAGDSGSLPTATAAFGGGLGIGSGSWRLEAAMGWWIPRSKTLGGTGVHANSNAEFGMWSVAARTCWRLWFVEGAGLGPCFGLEAARRSGTAAVISDSQPSKRWDGAIAAALRAERTISQDFALRLDLDVLVPWDRAWFGYYEQGLRRDVYRPAGVQLRALVGLEWHFW